LDILVFLVVIPTIDYRSIKNDVDDRRYNNKYLKVDGPRLVAVLKSLEHVMGVLARICKEEKKRIDTIVFLQKAKERAQQQRKK